MKTFKEYIIIREGDDANWCIIRWSDGAVIAGPMTIEEAHKERERLYRADEKYKGMENHRSERYVINSCPEPGEKSYNTVAWRNPDATHKKPWRLTSHEGDYVEL